MKYNINPQDAPEELVAIAKRKFSKEFTGKKPDLVELRFNQRFDHVRVIDVAEFTTIARIDLNYKEDDSTSTENTTDTEDARTDTAGTEETKKSEGSGKKKG